MLVTAGEALAHGIARLGGSESPRTDAMLLLARALQRSRAWIVAHGDAPIGHVDAAAFDALCEARATGVPLAYVLGEAGFYGRTFAVDARVLVPRPETERLVETALEGLRRLPRAPRVLDVGTGSGAIACTLAAELPRATVVGIDLSPDALEVARVNARRLQVDDRCRFACGDLTEPARGARFDAVLANLPYVASGAVPGPPDPLGFEPRGALDGGADGLAVYRRFLPDAPALMVSGAILLMEAAPAQIPELLALARQVFPTGRASAGRDFGGDERFVRVEACAP